MNRWLLLTLAILSEVVGTSCLKISGGFTKVLPSAVLIVGYGAAFYLLSLTLHASPIGTAYAIWAGAGTALIAGIGWIVFGQALDVAALLGIALIIAGIVVLNTFSSALAH